MTPEEMKDLPEGIEGFQQQIKDPETGIIWCGIYGVKVHPDGSVSGIEEMFPVRNRKRLRKRIHKEI